MVRTLFIEGTYLVASILFILGLRSLTRTEQAQRGMQQAALGMLLAIIGTLVNHSIIQYQWIVVGLVVGTVIGYPLGMWVPMTSMPQAIAISHLFGALAATLVGVAEYHNAGGVIVVGETVARAFDDLYYLERACQLQVLAMQTGRPLRQISRESLEHTVQQRKRDVGAVPLHLAALKRMLDKTEPDYAE
jgi:hypothetical protein